MKIPEQYRQSITILLEKYHYYVLGGVLVFVFFIYYLVGMRPQLEHLNSINPQIDILKTQLSEAKENISRFSGYQAEATQLKQKFKNSGYKILAREEVPALLESISTLAVKNKIRIEKIMAVKGGQELLQSNKEGKYYSFPVKLEGRGGYHDIGRFIDQLEKDEVFKSISALGISSNKDDELHHAFNLTIKSVVIDKPENQGSASAK